MTPLQAVAQLPPHPTSALYDDDDVARETRPNITVTEICYGFLQGTVTETYSRLELVTETKP